MQTVIIVIHLMIVVGLIATVLLQRSEGGALGIGGGGGGGFMSGRGAANALTRATAILAGAFFATSILLTLLAKQSIAPTSIFDGVTGNQNPTQQGGGVLPLLKPGAPQPPASAPASGETAPQPGAPQPPAQ